MITCQVCGRANRDGSRFCNECGRRLDASILCPVCGQNNPGDARYCDGCGARIEGRLTATTSAPEPESPFGPRPREDAARPPSAPLIETPDDLGPAHAIAPDAGVQTEVAAESEVAESPPARSAAPADVGIEPRRDADVAEPPAEPLASAIEAIWRAAEARPAQAATRPSQPTPDAEAESAAKGSTSSAAVHPDVQLRPEPEPVVVRTAQKVAPSRPEPTGQATTEGGRGPALAKSLAGPRPRVSGRRPDESVEEAAQAFAAVACEPAQPTQPASPRLRLPPKLLGLVVVLALAAGVAVAGGDQVQAVPTIALESASHAAAQVFELAQSEAASISTGQSSGGPAGDGQAQKGGSR